jgi:hypothetical protein
MTNATNVISKLMKNLAQVDNRYYWRASLQSQIFHLFIYFCGIIK